MFAKSTDENIPAQVDFVCEIGGAEVEFYIKNLCVS